MYTGHVRTRRRSNPSFQLFEIVQSVQHNLFGGFLYLTSEENFVEDGVYLLDGQPRSLPSIDGPYLVEGEDEIQFADILEEGVCGSTQLSFVCLQRGPTVFGQSGEVVEKCC